MNRPRRESVKQENEQTVPRARKADLVVRELPDELLVYDLQRDKAHCLNRSAAFVWKQCNGRRTVGDVARALAKELRTPVDEQTVWLALEQLGKFNLLEEKAVRPAHLPRLSRRDMLRLGVAAAAALPVIVSVVAPTAASAQTAITPAQCAARQNPNCGGTPCTTGGTCQRLAPGNTCTCQ
jgi:Coenzyme PQQ synthesis protein D (PqqD)